MSNHAAAPAATTAPVWGTAKTHGKPESLVYLGSDRAKPRATGTLLTGMTYTQDGPRGFNAAGQQVWLGGVATRFWSAPAEALEAFQAAPAAPAAEVAPAAPEAPAAPAKVAKAPRKAKPAKADSVALAAVVGPVQIVRHQDGREVCWTVHRGAAAVYAALSLGEALHVAEFHASR